MLLPIVQYGDPILRKQCKPVGESDAALIELVGNMLDTMADANGVGLAAPQIGEDLQLAVIDVSHDPECVSYLRVNGEDAEIADINPLFPALQSSPAAFSGASRKKQIPSNQSWTRVPFAVGAPGTGNNAHQARDVGIVSAFTAPRFSTSEFYRLSVR
jgi:hypothetical protein